MSGHDPFRASSNRRLVGPLPDRDPHDGRPLRVLAVVHLYPPTHNAGAEVMLHALLRDLVTRGWEAHVLATDYRGDPYELDGVTVEKAPDDVDVGESMAWCDVAVTHLDATRRAVAWARRGRPLVHIVHNHAQFSVRGITPRDCSLAVWNSEWIRDHHAGWRGREIVVRPPVNSADYATARPGADRVTLLNLYAPKGAAMFWHLARQRPHERFLAVLGAYGNQEVPDVVPANVEVVAHTPHVVAEVYARTRVLLVPSHYESWGRVAVEAMASGIPVVASPTPGLLEALTSPTRGECAIFADHGRPDLWHQALDTLARRPHYDVWSDRAFYRSAELDRQTDEDLDVWAAELHRLATLPSLLPTGAARRTPEPVTRRA